MVSHYESMGVRALYPWQADCLEVDNGRVLMGANLVYRAPTSGGKTFVAEILILRSLIALGKKCLFILPFISVVTEKVMLLPTTFAAILASGSVSREEIVVKVYADFGTVCTHLGSIFSQAVGTSQYGC